MGNLIGRAYAMPGVIKGLLRLFLSPAVHTAAHANFPLGTSSERANLTVLPFSRGMRYNQKGLCEIHSGALLFWRAV